MKNVLDDPGGNNEGDTSSCARAVEWVLSKTGPLKITEIGTGYGTHLHILTSLASSLICVDAMYDWVPDVKPDEIHAEARIDSKKLESWNMHAELARKTGAKVELIIGNSFDPIVHENPVFLETELLIIDGCHHPADAVFQDYLNFRKHMTTSHYLVWDDVQESDPMTAVQKCKEMLKNEGRTFFEKRHKNTLIMYVE